MMKFDIRGGKKATRKIRREITRKDWERKIHLRGETLKEFHLSGGKREKNSPEG